MRIGLFSDTYLPEINGVASSVHILREALEAMGHTVFVITTKSPGCEEDDHVVRLSGIELKKLYGYVMTSPINIKVYAKIKEMNLDIIHAHTEFSVGIFARIVSKLQSIPLVSTYHTTYEDYTHYVNVINSDIVDKLAKKAVSRLSRLYADSSTEVISPSLKTKEMLQRYKIKKNIHVVPTGLQISRFSYSEEKAKKGKEIRKELGIKEDECLIVYLGRLAQEKSIDMLIDGIAVLKEKQVNCKLMIVGGGPCEDELKEQAKRLNVEQHVLFVGKKTANEVPAYYAAADCFASASTTETQGMTYIEALASGLLVLARPDEILGELIDEGETGYYFDNKEEFSAKVQEFMKLSKEQKQQKAICAEKKVEPYNMEKFYEGIMKVYDAALNQSDQKYQIDKIRLKNDYVYLDLVTLKKESIKILVDVDVYFEKGYRKGRFLSQDEVDQLLEMEEAVKAYQRCLRKLSVKDRTRKEMYDWLTQNTQLEIEDINKIINRLEEHEFIDDYRYTKDTVYNMKMTLSGEKKIYRTLRKKGIHPDMISEVLTSNRDDDLEYNNAMKWAKKTLGTIKNKSVKMTKKVLFQKMLQQGFSGDVLDRVMADLEFFKDEREEMDVLRKVAGKAKKRSEKKYQGSQLRNVVYRYCAAQGFEAEHIYAILDEMEWDDEKD